MGRWGGVLLVAGVADTGVPEAGASETSTSASLDSGNDATSTDASDGAAASADSLPANRDRLLSTYLAYLKATPGALGANSFWRDSHDLGGAHASFDISDETDNGAPRGQVQYFADVTSAAAKAPLGRTDLMTLVDPYALEVDQDYDCTHNSNPVCSYVTYGALCFPGASKLGTALYSEKYGDFDPTWKPVDCAGK